MPHCLHLLDAHGRVLVQPLLAVACKFVEVQPTFPAHALFPAALSHVSRLGLRRPISLLDLLADRIICGLQLASPGLAPRGDVQARVIGAARVR
eukprot:1512505-Pleurochrysis_carterae.AAC.1